MANDAGQVTIEHDVRHLLSAARMVLDRVAEGSDVTRSEAGMLAQRIVDVIGHSTTDEPPHLLLSVEDTLRYADAHRISHADCTTCPDGKCYEWWTILRDDLRRLLSGWGGGR